MKLNPFTSFLRANWNLLNGRYRFPKECIGEVIEYEGQQFTIFRQMFVDIKDAPEPQAVFRVRFHVEDMSPKLNNIFSIFTIPLFSGLPGFRSKLW